MKKQLHVQTVMAFACLLAMLMVSAAPTRALRQTEPVTYYEANTNFMQDAKFDPQRAAERFSIHNVVHLFLSLTDLEPAGGIMPRLATGWQANNSGTVWTFTLRNDVPWVRLDPATGNAEILRTVTAFDVEYGFKRLCDPRLEAPYTPLAARVVLGCKSLAAMDPQQVTDADYDLVQVKALDDTTLEVHLQSPTGFFLSQTSMWIFRPVPREIIEEFGESWTVPGTIVTNGPFLLSEWDPQHRIVFIRNPHLPEDLQGPGNVEQAIITSVPDSAAGFALYRENVVDSGPVTLSILPDILADATYSTELITAFDLTSVYFAIAHDKAPFDNVHVRRAFSAAVDRAQLIQYLGENFSYFAQPMIHFTPPGVFGAPPIDQIGVGFDPEYAREQFALAGYPNCEGFPEIRMLAGPPNWTRWFEFLAESAESVLGCERDLFHIEDTGNDWVTFIESTDPAADPADRPHLWSTFWAPDYADAHNYVGDVLSCNSFNAFNRPCTEVDNLIDQAAAESDPATRVALYQDIAELFFGPEGEFPIIPLFMYSGQTLFKPWADVSGLLIGTSGARYDWITIDQAAQLAARGP